MEEGILIKIGTTNFEDAVTLCEQAFDDPAMYPEEWKKVKDSKDFKELSLFLKTHDVDNEVFRLND